MANGTIHKLGTLLVGSSAQALSSLPYNNNESTSITYSIGDTQSGYELQWVEVNDGGETYLICDRNIVYYISWNRLNTLGFCNAKGTNGKTITIDNQDYELFMMTGGTSSSDTNDDWDHWICNGSNLSGLNSGDDSVWHWSSKYSWCQNASASGSSYRVYRGHSSASYWYNYGASLANSYFAWRPALRVLNAAPVITPASKDFGSLRSAPSISISVTESDGEAFTGTVTLDGTQKQTFSGTASGTYTINIGSWWDSLSDAKHTIVVTATDSQSASSSVTYTVTKVFYPTLSIAGDTYSRVPSVVFTGTDGNQYRYSYKEKVS